MKSIVIRKHADDPNRMQLEFTDVNVEMTPWTLYVERSYSSEFERDLIVEKLKSELGGMMEATRRKAYEQGWKDKAAKRKKATWFSRWCGI